MPSQQDMTTFTLSFHGVEFCLEPLIQPSQHQSNPDVLSMSNFCNDHVTVNLSNFSGVLRVKRSSSALSVDNALPTIALLDETETSNTAVEQHIEASATNGEHQCIAAPDQVPEDVSSPEQKKEEKSQTKKKGQQTLNFFGTGNPSKKVGRKMLLKVNASNKSSKRNTREEDTPKTSCRKKTRSNANHHDDELSIEVQETQNTKFTLASLGQSMPSQESDLMEEDAAVDGASTNEEGNVPNDITEVDVRDHEHFTFNMDSSSRCSHDFSFKTDVTPEKNEIVKVGGSTFPCPRWGQSMTMIDHRRLVIYGGQTVDPSTQTAKPLADLFVYDLLEHEWTKPMNCEGVARTWHTATFLPDKQLLLCFGGDVVDEKTGKTTTTEEVMVLDTEIMLWFPPSVSGQVPSGRSGHTASLLNNSNELVVFGGVKNGKWLNSISVLDTGRWKWSTPKVLGDAPPPRSYHSATSLGSSDENSKEGRIVIFGGNNDTKCFNGVHVLEQANGKMSWSHPKVSGKAPAPRTGHTATLLEDGSTILIYGGWDPDQKGDDLIFGDSFLLDTKCWTWKKGPKPRYSSFNNAAAENGGLDRVGHSAVLAPGAEGVQVLAFGGRLPDGFSSDFQSLILAPLVPRETGSRKSNTAG
ncbi:hypothetical protein ACHAWX_007181 [Stephanocyclus meneghinianus]